MRRSLGLVILLLYSGFCLSQRLKPQGEFLVDSLKIGEEVPYSLTMEYPLEMEVMFPDSNFDYSPFEFVRKEYFTSSLDSGMVTDKVIYHLASFEIDPVQSLSLPVFLLSEGDSTRISANPDSIFLVEMVPVMPDSVALKEDVSYISVNQAFNYPYLLIGLGVAIIVAVIIYFAFGDQIRRKIRLYRLEKAYKKFTGDFDRLFSHLRKSESQFELEKLLVVWKKYMEGLENRPYTKLTSKEIGRLSDAGDLNSALREIDRSIYSSSSISKVFKSLKYWKTLPVRDIKKRSGR